MTTADLSAKRTLDLLEIRLENSREEFYALRQHMRELQADVLLRFAALEKRFEEMRILIQRAKGTLLSEEETDG